MQPQPDGTSRRKSTPRWLAKIVKDPVTSVEIETPLTATAEPVSVHFSSGLLLRDSGEVRYVPTDLRAGRFSNPVGDGRYLFFQRLPPLQDQSIPWSERDHGAGLFRLRFSDLSCERLPFEARAGVDVRAIGASPDGQRVVVAGNWMTHVVPRVPRDATLWAMPQEERRAIEHAENQALRGAMRTTLTLVDVGTGEVREIATLNGYSSTDMETEGVQWSPDGTKVAVSLNLCLPVPGTDNGELTQQHVVRVWDVASGAVVGTLRKGYSLRGSLSWSADSTRLLVERNERVRVLDITTGKVSRIPALPEPMPEPPGNGKHRLLGFTPDDRLFTVTHRGKVVNLWRMHPETGEAEPLARWSGSRDLYPVLGRMPADYWD